MARGEMKIRIASTIVLLLRITVSMFSEDAVGFEVPQIEIGIDKFPGIYLIEMPEIY